MIKIFEYLTILLTFYITAIACQGYYSIIAPNSIRPNSQFHVAVSVHKSSEPVTIKVGITGTAYSNFKIVEVLPYSTELVQFEVENIKSDHYHLLAEGLNGFLFRNETSLHYSPKKFTVMVQTDKAIYQPGDIMKYRVLVMNSNLRPARKFSNVDVHIVDPQKLIVKELIGVQLTSAVYSDEMEFSSFPELGEWSINVDVDGEVHTKTFEIAEYIVPKFNVEIDTKKDVAYSDGKISAVISTNYHFGKHIQGETTISVYPKFFGSVQPFVFDLITRKTVPIHGKAYVEFDIKNELKFLEDYKRDVLLEAVVEEAATGMKQNVSTVITLHKDKYIIKTIDVPHYYIPGVPFTAIAKVVNFNGSALENADGKKVTAYLTNSFGNTEVYNKTEYTLDASGTTKMRFTVPLGEKDYFHSVLVNYDGIPTDIGRIPKKSLYSDKYIHAQVINEKPTINKDIVVAVTSNVNMKYFVYQVVGRGDILLSRTMDVGDSKESSFKFIASFAMMPVARVLVYMVVDGEFIFDELEVNFGTDLTNFVKLDGTSRSSPLNEVDITITARPYSYLGLMAVDKYAADIRSGNDFSVDLIMKELEKYDLNDVNTGINTPGKENGVLTLTNSAYYAARVHPGPQIDDVLADATDDGTKMSTVKKTDIGPAYKFKVNTRPPLAGPYAFSRIPKPFWNRPRVHVKDEVEDTWIFMNISSGNEGRTTIHKRLPASTHSWVVSGFSLDPVNGLGFVQTPKTIESFRTFYMTTDLPYSIKLSEVLQVPFVVFNNQQRDLSVDVTMYNTDQSFEFVKVDNDLEKKTQIQTYSRQTINVPANERNTAFFLIRPKSVGDVTIKAAATAEQSLTDSISQTLKVIYPGRIEYNSSGYALDLRSGGPITKNITLEIPPNIIENSAKIEVKVYGDPMAPIIKNLGNLVTLPRNSGEASMVDFVPAIVMLDYLVKTKMLSPAIELKATKTLELGYQKQLYFRHTNGAFSFFGNSIDNSSTWLTAYTARFFKKAAKYTQIDKDVISSALEYLAGIQDDNGGFPEKGDPYLTEDLNNVSLTAFVLLAFIENKAAFPEYHNLINKGVNYVVREMDTSNDLYTLAIGCYLLYRGNHNAKSAFIQKLDSLAMQEGDRKWFMPKVPSYEKKSPWYNNSYSLAVEVSSYVALALLENDSVDEATDIINWLVDQQNQYGGFVSSHDSVLALMALASFQEKVKTSDNSAQIKFTYGNGLSTQINLNNENTLVEQTYELPSYIRNLTMTASGKGIAYAKVNYKYNTNITGAWPRFVLDPQVNRISHKDYLHLSICTSFVSVDSSVNNSNLAVMEVELPSGFVVDMDTLPSLEGNERITKVETQNRGTKVIIYFDYVGRKEICPTLDAHKVYKVTEHKAASVIIYDYYDSARRARLFYRAPKSTLCDICEGPDTCGNSCERAELRQSRRLDDGFHSAFDDDDTNKSKTSSAGLPGRLVTSLQQLLLLFVAVSVGPWT